MSMLNWLKNKRNKKGFSLVELIIVVAILAILVGVLAPQYLKYVEKSRKSTDVSNLDTLVNAVKTASADTEYNIVPGTYTITMTSTATTISYSDGTVAGTPGTTQSVSTKTKVMEALNEYSHYKFEADSDNAKCDNLKLKSNRWPSNTIKATIVLDEKSSLTVTFDPANVLDEQ